MADYGTRWQSNWKNKDQKPPMTVEQALELLDRAATFHEADCAHFGLSDVKPISVSTERMLQTKMISAFRPPRQSQLGTITFPVTRPAGEATSMRQPLPTKLRDGFSRTITTRFILAYRLLEYRKTRLAEAAAYYSACSALRPKDIRGWFGRRNATSNWADARRRRKRIFQRHLPWPPRTRSASWFPSNASSFSADWAPG